MVIKKTPAEIEAMKAAGQLSAAVLREVGKRCVPGVSTLELDEFAEDYIRSHGGIPTFKGYAGFPGSICASVNEEIVHGIPSARKKLKAGDILSVRGYGRMKYLGIDSLSKKGKENTAIELFV